MSEIKKLTEAIIEFRNERDWKQFHNPKDSAMALMSEAAEVLNHFLWKNPEEMAAHIVKHHEDVSEELVDVLFWVLLMSHDLKVDILEASYRKLDKNKAKYPVEKAKGCHTKYTEL